MNKETVDTALANIEMALADLKLIGSFPLSDSRQEACLKSARACILRISTAVLAEDLTARKHKVLDHGANESQHFPGAGLCGGHEEFGHCATGIGGTPFEAMEDALEDLANEGWNVDSIKNDLPNVSQIPESVQGEEDNGWWHYVTVYVSRNL